MPIKYPNGKTYNPIKGVNKPKKLKKLSHSNRGMTLEDDLNETNQYYLDKGIAVIHKKPTPVQIVNVDYPKRSAAVIKEAYFKQASTTDYNGVYNGRYIDFEAKETRNKTSFPLQNFHEHQIQHMKRVIKQKGISFVILCFAFHGEIFLLNGNHLFTYWDNHLNGERKSIPKQDIEELGYSIKLGFNPRIDYLRVLDKIYF